ncbi:hypothetical protein E2C01_072624 [Portunus trituberculatus]|uniref:Uncharacterized protein n=1 Tax=Portunus trituberculatus TaxID=210409 RepID=A0A5B7I772_PORTR|nr:hypothetical protein [Portunus trituberculatus]
MERPGYHCLHITASPTSSLLHTTICFLSPSSTACLYTTGSATGASCYWHKIVSHGCLVLCWVVWGVAKTDVSRVVVMRRGITGSTERQHSPARRPQYNP